LHIAFHQQGFYLVLHRVRTSSGTFLARGQDKIIRGIEKRIADFTFIPVGMYSFLVENTL
jgi:sulfur transfer complex TusBCD TusB component (DsrH family)